MKKALYIMVVMFFAGLILGGNTAAGAADLGLVKILSDKLGVTQQQASGGAGAIFNVAKQNMSVDDFTDLAKAVPNIDKMMADAPETETKTGLLGKASSLLGSGSSSASKAASLANSFSQLGMKEGMVSAFTPIILNYVKEKGGELLMNTLQNALQ